MNEAQQYVSSNLMAVGLKEKSAELSIDNIKHLKQQKFVLEKLRLPESMTGILRGGAVSLAHLLNDDFWLTLVVSVSHSKFKMQMTISKNSPIKIWNISRRYLG